MFLYFDDNNIIRSASDYSVDISGTKEIETSQLDGIDLKTIVGKKIRFNKYKNNKLRVAVICNWGDKCGIATYTESLLNSFCDKIEIKIFAEYLADDNSILRCWQRGQSMTNAIDEIKKWNPDIVHIQHEFGIFPKATHFLKMLEMLDNIPYVITLHSTYEHLDKTICTGYIKNIIVHSDNSVKILRELGHTNNIYKINHGCPFYDDPKELWNIFQTDYAIIQFGFGFQYKGVDMAIDAINILKNKNDKFKEIFYCYLCSENPHTVNVHNNYYSYIKNKIDELGLTNNIAVMRGFASDQIIINFLRTAKLAIFPYKTDPNNTVYGASGAIRHAMANGIPVVASDSHLFDDLEGIVPRANSAESLAKEIDRIFSDGNYKKNLTNNNKEFLKRNTWDITADRHIEIYKNIINDYHSGDIVITDAE